MAIISELKYSIPTFVGLALTLIGAGSPNARHLGLLGALVLLLACTRMVADTLNGPRFLRLSLGLIASLSVFMIFGSGVYYAATISPASLAAALCASTLLVWLLTRRLPRTDNGPKRDRNPLVSGVLLVVVGLCLVLFFKDVTSVAVAQASRSVWLHVPRTALLWFALASLCTLILALKRSLTATVLSTTALLFSALSVAAFVYPLGYGFDPFLHRATIEHIALTGTITPKPFYYIGQYVLELVPVVFGSIQPAPIDNYLVPVLAALLLPSIAAFSTWHVTKRPQPAALASLSSLLLPLSSFINTTPQGLANLWFLSLALLALPELATGTRHVPWRYLLIIALASVLTHPLAGLPCLLFLALFFLIRSPHIPAPARMPSLVVASIAGAFMLPAAFLLGGPQGTLSLDLSRLVTLLPSTFFSTRFDLTGDLLALLGANQWLWLLVLAGIGGSLLHRFSRKAGLLYPLVAGILLLNAVLLSSVGDFSFLIDYEQTNYTDRVIQAILYVLLPLSIAGVALGTEKLLTLKHATARIGIAILIVASATASLFVAYPRHDAYAISRGFTVGRSDFNTVASIASDAGDEPYVVLANQAVSAAAISQNGFLHYYGENEDVFYYPVPTGGPLYQIFLEMIENTPSKERALDAMNLTGVAQVYFVVNDYWWSADRAREQAKVTADDWYEIDDGRTTVFLYKRSSIEAN